MMVLIVVGCEVILITLAALQITLYVAGVRVPSVTHLALAVFHIFTTVLRWIEL